MAQPDSSLCRLDPGPTTRPQRLLLGSAPTRQPGTLSSELTLSQAGGPGARDFSMICLTEPGGPDPGPVPPAGLAAPTPADQEGLPGLERSEVAQGLLERLGGEQGPLLSTSTPCRRQG